MNNRLIIALELEDTILISAHLDHCLETNEQQYIKLEQLIEDQLKLKKKRIILGGDLNTFRKKVSVLQNKVDPNTATFIDIINGSNSIDFIGSTDEVTDIKYLFDIEDTNNYTDTSSNLKILASKGYSYYKNIIHKDKISSSINIEQLKYGLNKEQLDAVDDMLKHNVIGHNRTLSYKNKFLPSDHSPICALIGKDKVMTWNVLAFVDNYFIRYNEETKNYNSSKRLSDVLNILKQYEKTDYFLLQEVNPELVIPIMDILTKHDYIYDKHPTRDDGLMIIFKPTQDKEEIGIKKSYYLPKTLFLEHKREVITKLPESKSEDLPNLQLVTLSNNSINFTLEEVLLIKRLKAIPEVLSNKIVLRIAGGWIRDKLLIKQKIVRVPPPNDIDLAIENASGVTFANILQREGLINGASVVEQKPDKSKNLETVTTTIKLDDQATFDIDLVGLREEIYTTRSRIPIVKLSTPKRDAYRRDLTINSLFYNINSNQIEDYTGMGISDLHTKTIRTPLDPVTTFTEDPLRILRVARFAAKIDGQIDQSIKDAVLNPNVRASFKNKISQERSIAELQKMKKPGYLILAEWGIWTDIFKYPWLPHLVENTKITMSSELMKEVKAIITTSPEIEITKFNTIIIMLESINKSMPLEIIDKVTKYDLNNSCRIAVAYYELYSVISNKDKTQINSKIMQMYQAVLQKYKSIIISKLTNSQEWTLNLRKDIIQIFKRHSTYYNGCSAIGSFLDSNKFLCYSFLAIYCTVDLKSVDAFYASQVWKLSNKHSNLLITLLDFTKFVNSKPATDKKRIKDLVLYSFNKSVNCLKDGDILCLSKEMSLMSYRKLFLTLGLLLQKSLGFDVKDLLVEVNQSKYSYLLSVDMTSLYSDVEYQFVIKFVHWCSIETLKQDKDITKLVDIQLDTNKFKATFIKLLDYNLPDNAPKSFKKKFRREMINTTKLESSIRKYIIEVDLDSKKLEFVNKILEDDNAITKDTFSIMYMAFIKDISNRLQLPKNVI